MNSVSSGAHASTVVVPSAISPPAIAISRHGAPFTPERLVLSVAVIIGCLLAHWWYRHRLARKITLTLR